MTSDQSRDQLRFRHGGQVSRGQTGLDTAAGYADVSSVETGQAEEYTAGRLRWRSARVGGEAACLCSVNETATRYQGEKVGRGGGERKMALGQGTGKRRGLRSLGIWESSRRGGVKATRRGLEGGG